MRSIWNGAAVEKTWDKEGNLYIRLHTNVWRGGGGVWSNGGCKEGVLQEIPMRVTKEGECVLLMSKAA